MVFEIEGKYQYSCYFVGCCFQDLFSIARRILVWFPSCIFSIHFVRVYLVHPWNSIGTTAAWKKFRFILSNSLDFHMKDILSIAVHTFARSILISLSVDKTQLPRYVKLFTNFREASFRVEMSPWLKYVFRFVCNHVEIFLLPAPAYAARILLGWVYLSEALCHLRSLRLSSGSDLFQWEAIFFY